MKKSDIIVIGGGPAGLLAAATAAGHGASVLLLERMDRPGRKLRICGKGRGNIGNTAPLDEFLSHFGKNFRFLRPAFGHFAVFPVQKICLSAYSSNPGEYFTPDKNIC